MIKAKYVLRVLIGYQASILVLTEQTFGSLLLEVGIASSLTLFLRWVMCPPSSFGIIDGVMVFA